MRKSIGLGGLVLFAGSITACGATPESGLDNLQQESTISGSQTDTAVLGTAYNSDKNKVFNLQCVTGTPEYRGNSVGQIQFTRDMSYDSALNTLAGGLSIGLTLPVVSAEASAHLATEHSSTSLSETYHVYWVGVAQKEVYKAGTLGLSSYGQNLVDNQANLIEARCGNEFITEVHRGASLLATLKVEFFSSTDRTEVGGKIKVDVLAGLVSADGNLEYVDEDKKKRTKISVMVDQRGGSPERLLTILPENIMSCSMDNAEPCLEVFRNLIAYAKSDYSQQLQDPVKWNVLKYQTQTYADSGMDDLIPSAGYQVIEQAVKNKIKTTENKLRAAMQDEQRASTLLTTGAPYMTTHQRDMVHDIEVKASNNIVSYAELSRYCYENMNTNCLTHAADTETNAEVYNPNDLDVKPPVKGDVTEDGCVNQDDLDIFATSYGYQVSSGADPRADFNKDGWVDDLDYVLLQQHWQEGC